jgi:PKD repeat protein
MKKTVLAFIGTFSSIAILIFSISTQSCQKEVNPPKALDIKYLKIEGVEVSNGQVISLGYNTAKFQGDFKKLEAFNFKIVDYGYVVSSITNEPTIGNNEGISSLGERSGVGAFESQISGLKENTTYYARVYLVKEINSTGVREPGYHPFSISFKTKPGSPPILFNLETKKITTSSFELNSLIRDENLLSISQYGHIWSKTNPNLDINNKDGLIPYGSLQSVFTHQYSSDITGLSANTDYYIKAYATNQYGTGYSSSITVRTAPPVIPVKADFTFYPNIDIQLGTTIGFNNSSSLSAVNYKWDFGDGTFSQDKNPQKAYSSVGQYQVKLVSSDISGFSKDSIFKSIFVMSPNIVYYPLNGGSEVVADVTPIAFSSLNDGFSTSSWYFGNGEGASNDPSPNYTFNSEGIKNVTLIKTGPGGQVSENKQIKVWATGPCNHRDFPNNHSIDNIQFIENNGLLQTGTIKVNHNYGGCANIYLYHPNDWSNGNYTPWGNYYFQVCTPGLSNTFWIGSPSNPVVLGGDWGIKIMFTNGVESCVRTLRDVGAWNNNEFVVLSSKIFEGQ